MNFVKCRINYVEDIKRTVLVTSGKEKAMQLFLARCLRNEVASLHPHIYCSPQRKTSRLIHTILKTRFDGMYWGACDIKQAYLNVDNLKVIKELKRAGLPGYIAKYMGLEKLKVTNSKIAHRGLPQGFNTSQYLYNLYINPIIKKMNRSSRWQVYVYVDDIFWCARTRKNARECRRILRRSLERYGYKGRQMSFSEKEQKMSFIASPHEEFKALGFKFNPIGVEYA